MACILANTRSALNPMDKGVCNSTNSEIQTWQPNTNYSIFIYSLTRILAWMSEYIMVDTR